MRFASLGNAGHLAATTGQPAFLHWSADGLSVVRTTTLEVVDSWAVEAVPVEVRACVMGGWSTQERCRKAGGPWTSSSTEASLVWQLDQQVRLAALGGCDVCGGRDPGPGRALGLTALSVRSRWAPRPHHLGPALGEPPSAGSGPGSDG